MIAVATRGRHDQTDLRRLAELGITPLHWRRSLVPTGATGTVHIIHNGATSDSLLDDLLRAITLAGMSPQLSNSEESEKTISPGRVIRLGTTATVMNPPDDTSKVLTLPTLAVLRGNAFAKRDAWLKLRTLLQQ